jgi:hypothetical protein
VWYNLFMAKKNDIAKATVKETAPEVVFRFLKENRIRPKITFVEDLNAWVGDGYVLNDKPLLKLTYEWDK